MLSSCVTEGAGVWDGDRSVESDHQFANNQMFGSVTDCNFLL